MSQPMPFPRPRPRPDDMPLSVPEDLPKRVPGAALQAAPELRRSQERHEHLPLAWQPRPRAPRHALRDRIIAALRARLGR